MAKVWNFNKADGSQVVIELIKNRRVSVNGGEEIALKNIKSGESNFAMKVFDIPVGDDEVAKLCVANKKILTYNGVDVETGKPYGPMKFPGWTYVFVVLYVINFFVVAGGAIGACLSMCGATLSARISGDNSMATGLRVTLCILLYVGFTIVGLAAAIGFSALLA